jgi:hypothetical protein
MMLMMFPSFQLDLLILMLASNNPAPEKIFVTMKSQTICLIMSGGIPEFAIGES